VDAGKLDVTTLVLLHGLAACGGVLLLRRLGVRAFFPLALVPATAFVWLVTAARPGAGVIPPWCWPAA